MASRLTNSLENSPPARVLSPPLFGFRNTNQFPPARNSRRGLLAFLGAIASASAANEGATHNAAKVRQVHGRLARLERQSSPRRVPHQGRSPRASVPDASSSKPQATPGSVARASADFQQAHRNNPNILAALKTVAPLSPSQTPARLKSSNSPRKKKSRSRRPSGSRSVSSPNNHALLAKAPLRILAPSEIIGDLHPSTWQALEAGSAAIADATALAPSSLNATLRICRALLEPLQVSVTLLGSQTRQYLLLEFHGGELSSTLQPPGHQTTNPPGTRFLRHSRGSGKGEGRSPNPTRGRLGEESDLRYYKCIIFNVMGLSLFNLTYQT